MSWCQLKVGCGHRGVGVLRAGATTSGLQSCRQELGSQWNSGVRVLLWEHTVDGGGAWNPTWSWSVGRSEH